MLVQAEAIPTEKEDINGRPQKIFAGEAKLECDVTILVTPQLISLQLGNMTAFRSAYFCGVHS